MNRLVGLCLRSQLSVRAELAACFGKCGVLPPMLPSAVRTPPRPRAYPRKLPSAQTSTQRCHFALGASSCHPCDGDLCSCKMHSILGASESERAAACCWAHLLAEFLSASSSLGGLWPVRLGMLLAWQHLRENAWERVSSGERKNAD